MFESYLSSHHADPRRRAVVLGAAIVALAGTLLGVFGLWFVGKLAITRVVPATLEFVLVQFHLDEAPPPPPPPPPPLGDSEEEETAPEVPADPELLELEDPVDPSLDKVPPRAPPARRVPGVPNGDVRGVLGGVPGAPPGFFGSTGVHTREPARRDTAKAPIEAVRAQGIYVPDPPQAELQKTISARRDKKYGVNITSFCVSTRGAVTEVRTKQAFRGGADPEVDRICREAVQRWRFRPFVVGGKATVTCSEASFEISFR